MRKPVPFGKYFLLQRINVGGMAEVFRAKTIGVEGFQKIIAIKRILPNIAEDEEFTAMFIDEAKIAVQLSHANIAQIFDLGKIGDSYFIALEYVHGKDLRAIFDKVKEKGGRFSAQQAAFIAAKVAEGLDYAHDKRDVNGRPLNIVHRDVSPQNILVSYEGEVKLVDFGIAKAASKASKTQAGILKGKFGYMSPEQVEGLPLDRRSDIFSLGIIMFELLTGERLFKGESDYSTLEKVRNVEMVPPSSLVPSIPTEMERIVLKALKKRPEERYQTAGELLADLNRFMYSYKKPYSRDDLSAFMQRYFANDFRRESERIRLELERETPQAKERGLKPTTKVHVGPGQRPVAPVKPVSARASANQELASRTVEEVPAAKGAKHKRKVGTRDSDRLVQRPGGKDASPGGDDPTVVRDMDSGGSSRSRATPISYSHYPLPSSDKMDFVSRRRLGMALAVGAGAIVAVLVFSGLFFFKDVEDGSTNTAPLVVTSEPVDVLVSVNGRQVGDLTPLRIDLSPGKYMVEVEKDGYEKFQREVELEEGRPAVIEAKLKPLPKGNSTLVLKSRPKGVEIYMDGVKLDGTTPHIVQGVTAGEHRLRAAKSGYVEEVKTVVVSPGKKKVVKFVLRPMRSTLKVSSRPTGAEIWLDGKRSGKRTPAVFEGLPAHSRIKVLLKMPGYKDWWRYVRFDGLDEKSINPRLEPIEETARSDGSTRSRRSPRKRFSSNIKHGRRGKPATLNINVIIKGGGWAYVYVDGKKYGHTPKLGIKLPPGPHTVRLEDPKDPKKARVFRINLKPGKTMTLVKELK